jgi:uncharacterized protein
MKRVLLLALVMVIALAPTVFAQTAQQRELAAELLHLTNTRENAERLLEQVRETQLEQLEALELPPEEALEVQQRANDILQQELSWDSLSGDFIDLYATNFTQSELQAIVNFYNSPEGKTLTTKMPAVIQQSLGLVQERMERVVPRIQREIDDILAE